MLRVSASLAMDMTAVAPQCICCRSQLDRLCGAYWTPFADNRRMVNQHARASNLQSVSPGVYLRVVIV